MLVFISSLALQKKPCISLVKSPERRPWALKREGRPAAFAGRSESVLLGWDTSLAYTNEYPIPSVKRSISLRSFRAGTELEKLDCSSRANVGCNERDPLQQLIQAAQTAEDLLPHVAIDALVLHQEQVRALAVSLCAEEQASASLTLQ